MIELLTMANRNLGRRADDDAAAAPTPESVPSLAEISTGSYIDDEEDELRSEKETPPGNDEDVEVISLSDDED